MFQVLLPLATALNQSIIQGIQLQYEPSLWVVRTPKDVVQPEHFKVVTKASTEAKNAVPNVLDVRYGRKEGQRIDIYGTDLPNDSPIFVYTHGGYWQIPLTKNISAYPVIPLHAAGIKSIIVNHDLLPSVTIKEIIQEIRELAVFVLKMAIDMNSRGVWFGGHSSGAQLSVSLLQADWFNCLDISLRQMIGGFVLISGVFDVRPLVFTTYNENIRYSLKEAADVSPILYPQKVEGLRKGVSVLMAIGEHDTPAYHGQTWAYSKVLSRKNVHIEKIIHVRGADHFNIVENLRFPSYVLTKNIITLIYSSLQCYLKD